MSEVRWVPRLLMVLVIAGCAAQPMMPEPQPQPQPSPFRQGNPCSSGKAEKSTKQAPIVCIDDSAFKLRAIPDEVHVHNRSAANAKAPVTLQWFTKSGSGELHIEMEEGCFSETKCSGNGHCTLQTKPEATGKKCKYDVWITGDEHERLDPTVVVDGCCA